MGTNRRKGRPEFEKIRNLGGGPRYCFAESYLHSTKFASAKCPLLNFQLGHVLSQCLLGVSYPLAIVGKITISVWESMVLDLNVLRDVWCTVGVPDVSGQGQPACPKV